MANLFAYRLSVVGGTKAFLVRACRLVFGSDFDFDLLTNRPSAIAILRTQNNTF